jgi:hypothetical protein
MKPIRDKNAKDIKPGQTLKRVVDGRATSKGYKYKVIQRDWTTGDPNGEDLVADGGFIKELLDPTISKEFEVIDES